MADYANLKNSIRTAIKSNGNNEITGNLLQQILVSMVSNLGAAFQFGGVATQSTNPGTPDYNVAYIAGPGTYPNMGGSVVPSGYIGVIGYNGSWGVQLISVGGGGSVITFNSLPNGTTQILVDGVPQAVIPSQYTLLKLSAFTTTPNGLADGSFYYNTSDKKIYQKRDPSVAVIPYYDGAIYTYNNALYVWNGTDLVNVGGGGGGSADFVTEPDDLALVPAAQQGDPPVLKLANRAYNSQSPNGMGYKILRKDATFDSQVTDTNTIYEIRYDFDLDGITFNVPANCVLKFNGGKLGNGTIVGNRTTLDIPKGSKCFDTDLVLSTGFIVDYITPQNYGAIGDGTTDVSAIFTILNNCPYNIYIPSGDYVVNNFTFTKAKIWVGERTKSATQWFTDTCATIKTSTGITISGGPKISNLKVDYNGNALISDRPAGITLNSHFCELHSIFVSYFNIGVLVGGTNNCDYTKIYDLYSWYNYKAGVSVEHSANAQANFISFYDCNVGSNGVSVHDGAVAPDISANRGYGFYFHGGNAIYINNCDISSNEVCGICIDNQSTLYATRGLVIDTIYAEHNKYCNIYYKNFEDPDGCRTQFVSIKNAYFFNSGDNFFVEDVKKLYPFTPISVDLYGRFDFVRDGGSTSFYQGLANHKTGRLNDIFLIPNCKYKIRLKIMPKATGTLVFQNTIRGIQYSTDTGYLTPFISNLTGFSVAVTANEAKEFYFYLTTPNVDSPFIVYLPNDYGVDYDVVNLVCDNITLQNANDLQANTPVPGAMMDDNGVLKIYTGGDWKTPLTKETGTQDPVSGQIGDIFFNTVRSKPEFWDGTKWKSADGFDASLSHVGTTVNRPVLTQPEWGFMYLDTDIGKPIWWMGNVWIDAAGNAV